MKTITNLVRVDRITSAALATAILLAAGAANAQPADLSQVPIKTTDLGHMTYKAAAATTRRRPRRPARCRTRLTSGGCSTVAVGSSTALLTHINNAHISQQCAYFADTDVLIAGDNFINIDRYPMIDFGNSGDIRGMLSANDAFLHLANDNTKIIQPRRARHQGAGGRVSRQAGVSARPHGGTGCRGKSEQDARAAKPFVDLDGKWATNDQAAANFIRIVYNSFKRT